MKVKALISEGELYCTTGIENAYRRAFLDGLGGSRREATWNKYEHICCNSKVYWRHKSSCPALKFEDELTPPTP